MGTITSVRLKLGFEAGSAGFSWAMAEQVTSRMNAMIVVEWRRMNLSERRVIIACGSFQDALCLRMGLSRLPTRDTQLVQIVDSALADVARRSGEWLVCRVGCTQCCVGVFAISRLDAVRLQHGLAKLQRKDPARARAVRKRARQSVVRLAREFPGDPNTGILGDDEASLERFEEFGNNEVCPVLSPETGECELYASRPMTCRVFGPPIRSEDGLGVCELCYHGATPEEIAACELVTGTDDLEEKLIAQAEKATGIHGNTTVAFCLGTK
jgi:Fe-S-cluster containining protein